MTALSRAAKPGAQWQAQGRKYVLLCLFSMVVAMSIAVLWSSGVIPVQSSFGGSFAVVALAWCSLAVIVFGFKAWRCARQAQFEFDENTVGSSSLGRIAALLVVGVILIVGFALVSVFSIAAVVFADGSG